MKAIPIVPMGAVRMTQKDKWKPAAKRYFGYQAQLRAQLPRYVLKEKLPRIIFYLPMPRSWSEQKKQEMEGLPHKQKPDLDNLIKGFMDTVATEDCHVWRISGVEKRWAREGMIVID